MDILTWSIDYFILTHKGPKLKKNVTYEKDEYRKFLPKISYRSNEVTVFEILRTNIFGVNDFGS